MASRFSVETIFKGKDLVSRVLDRQIAKQRKLMSLSARQQKQQAIMGKMQRGIATGFLATGAAAGVAAVGMWKLTESGREFDTEMSKVRANMGDNATEKGLEKLRLKAAELGATTEFTSAQAASGLNELAKAGFNTEQQLGAVKAVLSGASAGEMEMAESAGILTSTMAGFELRSEDMATNSANAARVMDVLAVASTSTKSSISSLSESLKSVSPVAKQFGFSLEESVAMVAKMQDVGIEASESGNAIKTMLTKLTAGGPGVQKMLKELDVSFVDLNGDMKMPEEIFAQANKLKAGLKGNAAQAKAFADIVGLRGQKALTVLSDVFASGDGTALIEKLEGAKGAADRIAEIKLDNLNGDVVKLGSAWDGLTVALNDSLKGSLRPMIQEFTEWLGDPETKESIQFYTEKFIEWAPLLVRIAAVVGTVAGAIWLGIAATKAWAAAGAALNAVMLMNPIALLIAAIIVAIVAVIYYWDEFKLAGLMALDALAAPLIWLNNQLAKVFSGFNKIEQMQATNAEMENRERKADFAAMDAAKNPGVQADRGLQGNGGAPAPADVRGMIDVNVIGPATASAKGKGGVGLNVQNSGGFD
jgi:TP901 family phage tail tape measure protein